jgi:hypothetical protein
MASLANPIATRVYGTIARLKLFAFSNTSQGKTNAVLLTKYDPRSFSSTTHHCPALARFVALNELEGNETCALELALIDWHPSR